MPEVQGSAGYETEGHCYTLLPIADSTLRVGASWTRMNIHVNRVTVAGGHLGGTALGSVPSIPILSHQV